MVRLGLSFIYCYWIINCFLYLCVNYLIYTLGYISSNCLCVTLRSPFKSGPALASRLCKAAMLSRFSMVAKEAQREDLLAAVSYREAKVLHDIGSFFFPQMHFTYAWPQCNISQISKMVFVGLKVNLDLNCLYLYWKCRWWQNGTRRQRAFWSPTWPWGAMDSGSRNHPSVITLQCEIQFTNDSSTSEAPLKHRFENS